MYIFQYVFLTNTQTLDSRRTHSIVREDVLRWKTLVWSDSPFNKSVQVTQQISRPKQTDTHIYAYSQTEMQAGRPRTNWLLIAEWFEFERLNGAYYITARLESQEGYHWSLLTETIRSQLTMQTVWPSGAAARLRSCRSSGSRHCASTSSSAHEGHTIQFWE